MLNQEETPHKKLNWDGRGAASFGKEGLIFEEYGLLKGRRRTLNEIVKKAIEDVEEAFTGISRWGFEWLRETLAAASQHI
jgi:hypothetical protein